MANVFHGVISSVGSLEEIQTSHGDTIQRRRVGIHTLEEFPQSVVVTLASTLAAGFDLTVGEEITAYLRFRTFKSQDGTREFNDIRCYKYERGAVARPFGYEED